MAIAIENIVESYNSAACDDSYIVSPLYYRITGRKGAWYYKSKNAFVVVMQHPHKVNTLLVFPELGDGEYTLTASVLQKLYRMDHDIQLARYTGENIEQLKRALDHLKDNIVDDLEVFNEDSLDWRYPVHILNTQTVIEMKGKSFEEIRSRIRKTEGDITFEHLNRATAVKQMRAALKFWEGNMIMAGRDTDDMSEFYEEFFKIIENYTGRWDGIIFYKEKRPVGLLVWEEVSQDIANGLINIGDTTINGLSDFQIVTLSQILNDRGVRFLNVGGSETESLDHYKCKFMPEISVQLHSAKVLYKNFDTPPHIEYAKFV